MAVRKETIKKQFAEVVPPVLEPGETVLGGAYGVTGPNPMFAQGLLGMVGFLIFNMRYYYVALTDRRVVFMKASFWTGRPAGLGWADRRDTVTISDLQTDAKVWNWCRYSSPTKPKLRINFHRSWRDETKAIGDQIADRIVGPRLGDRAAGAAPPSPPPTGADSPPPPVF